MKNVFYFIFIFSSIFALLPTPILSSGENDFKFQVQKHLKKPGDTEIIAYKTDARRFLSGPGSFPPRCSKKCGRCYPCRPVHVTVPPGIPVTTEYYPEAWRCKCHNKLYMP